MRARHRRLALIAVWAQMSFNSPPPATAAVDAQTGLREVAFDRYGAATHGLNFLQRTFSPLAGEAMRRRLAAMGKTLAAQPLDLSKERFALYIPRTLPPPNGYALLVFIPPWDDANLPSGWASVLDQQGVIYVSAAKSGNDQDVLRRREPLALLAVDNVAARYFIDSDRVFIGGFSGGSKVAERLGLAFPDIFHGMLLNSGADRLGVVPYMVPARPLLSRLQDTMRIAYVVGRRDDVNVSESDESSHSMVEHCIFNEQTFTMPNAEHDVATPQSLSNALAYLSKPGRQDVPRRAACQAGWEATLARRLAAVDAAIAGPKPADARALIYKLDAELGGLAEPEAIERAENCSCKIFE